MPTLLVWYTAVLIYMYTSKCKHSGLLKSCTDTPLYHATDIVFTMIETKEI